MWHFYEAIPHKARSGRREPATDEPRLCDWGGAKLFLPRKAPRIANRIATHHPAIPQRFFGAMKKVAGGAAFAKEVPIRKIRKGETGLLCQRRAAILTAAGRFPARRPAIAAGDAGGLKIFHALHISSSFF